LRDESAALPFSSDEFSPAALRQQPDDVAQPSGVPSIKTAIKNNSFSISFLL